MVSVVEPLLVEIGEKLSSLERDLVLLTLRRFDESIAPTLTPSSAEMNLLLLAVKSQRRVAASDSLLSAAAIPLVADSAFCACLVKLKWAFQPNATHATIFRIYELTQRKEHNGMTSLLDRPITAPVCRWHAAKLWQTTAKLLKLSLISIKSCTTSKNIIKFGLIFLV